MDPLSLLIGAGVALSGVLVGRALGRSRGGRKPAAPANQPKAVCGCGHHLVFHDRETRKCRTQVIIPPRWSGRGEDISRTCMCQGYRGPTPLDEYYAPELLSEDPDRGS